MPTKAELWAEFEADGEAKVRENLAVEHYGTAGTYRRNFALEWLREKDQERSDAILRRNEASNAEQLRIARSAKNAAWTAAIAAIIAAIVAVIAMVIAVNSQ